MGFPTQNRAVRGYLELVRPANVATALADVLAGFAIAGLVNWPALLWLLVSQGWLDLHNVRAVVWIALVVLSLILAVGMSWSHVNRRLSGQTDVDPVDGR